MNVINQKNFLTNVFLRFIVLLMQAKHPKRAASLVYTTYVRVSPELRKKMDREMRRRKIETYSDFVRAILEESLTPKTANAT